MSLVVVAVATSLSLACSYQSHFHFFILPCPRLVNCIENEDNFTSNSECAETNCSIAVTRSPITSVWMTKDLAAWESGPNDDGNNESVMNMANDTDIRILKMVIIRTVVRIVAKCKLSDIVKIIIIRWTFYCN